MFSFLLMWWWCRTTAANYMIIRRRIVTTRKRFDKMMRSASVETCSRSIPMWHWSRQLQELSKLYMYYSTSLCYTCFTTCFGNIRPAFRSSVGNLRMWVKWKVATWNHFLRYYLERREREHGFQVQSSAWDSNFDGGGFKHSFNKHVR